MNGPIRLEIASLKNSSSDSSIVESRQKLIKKLKSENRGSCDPSSSEYCFSSEFGPVTNVRFSTSKARKYRTSPSAWGRVTGAAFNLEPRRYQKVPSAIRNMPA